MKPYFAVGGVIQDLINDDTRFSAIIYDSDSNQFVFSAKQWSDAVSSFICQLKEGFNLYCEPKINFVAKFDLFWLQVSWTNFDNFWQYDAEWLLKTDACSTLAKSVYYFCRLMDNSLHLNYYIYLTNRNNILRNLFTR